MRVLRWTLTFVTFNLACTLSDIYTFLVNPQFLLDSQMDPQSKRDCKILFLPTV